MIYKQDLNTNIDGYNTHLHHKDFKRQRDDLPGYSIYHVHCKCSTEPNETLKEALCTALIPRDLADNDDQSLRIRLTDEIKVRMMDTSNGKKINSINRLYHDASMQNLLLHV